MKHLVGNLKLAQEILIFDCRSQTVGNLFVLGMNICASGMKKQWDKKKRLPFRIAPHHLSNLV